MSAVNTHHPAEEEPRKRFREMLEDALPYIFAVPLYGPPVILFLGPWLLLVLLVIPPAAFLITLALVAVAAGGLLIAVGTLIASPYLLVRHLRGRPAPRLPRLAFVRRAAGPVTSRHVPITSGR